MSLDYDYIDVDIYTASDTSDNFADQAQTALQELDNSNFFNDFLGLDIYTAQKSGTPNIDWADSHEDVINDFRDYLENNYSESYFSNNEYYLLITDEAIFGAGATRGRFGDTNYNVEDEEVYDTSVLGFANAAVRWDSGCYGNDDVFGATVKHEFAHAMSADHGKGTITPNSECTYMNLWYTAAPCSFNDPPDSLCNGDPSTTADGIDERFSDCNEFEMDKFYRNHMI